ncbi:hypothetical protein Mlaev_00339 [Microbacterium laevaniformans]|jgi:hypothetical protein|uniref:Uncharacterized protein n=1 Tax=Microbacterium laevaniformans TaxID=36807 RepID=A0A150HHK3_9MICO|nr:hypothetical protein Mlaev_00339 [Microbacterium laevaniformans]
MKFRTHPTTKEAAPVASLVERPELWTPPHLTTIYDEVAAGVRERVTVATAVSWYADLSGGNNPLAGIGQTRDAVARRGALADHLREAIAHLCYNGVRPGSVGYPTTVTPYVPPRTLDGELRGVLVPGEPELVGLAARKWSEDTAAEFEEAVMTAVRAVLDDHPRAWQAFLHLVTIREANAEIARRTEAAQLDEQFRAARECPVCASTDWDRHGEVTQRALLQSWRNGVPDNPRILAVRSCEACWHIMSDALHAQLANEHVGNGTQTRADAAMQTLRSLSEGHERA